MFLVRDEIRKIKKTEALVFPRGFLIFNLDATKGFKVNCIPYPSEKPVTTKEFNEVIRRLEDIGNTLIEYYEESESGVELECLISRVKNELISSLEDGIIKAKT